MKTLNDSQAVDFVKKIYNMNNIIKNVYKNEPNFSPTYVLTNKCAYYYDVDCIPEIIKYKFDENLVDDVFQITLNAKDFFGVFKESGIIKNIYLVDISKTSIIIKYKDSNNIPKTYLINKDEKYNETIMLGIRQYESEIDSQEVISEVTMKEDLIKKIYETSNKSLEHLLIDVTNNNCHLIEDVTVEELEEVDYIEFFLCKKFLNGLSYKIKKLKKGDVVEYTPVYIKVNSIKSNDNNFNLNITLKLKNNDKIEHQFMICDF